VDAPGNDGNESMPEQVKRPNPRRKMMMMMMVITFLSTELLTCVAKLYAMVFRAMTP
jgi:hypothetical protein